MIAAPSAAGGVTWLDWAKLGIPAIVPGLISAVVVGGFSFLFNKRLERQRRTHNEEILRLGAEFNKSLQEKLEADRSQRAESLERQKSTYSEGLLRLGTELNRSLQEKLETDRSQRTESLEHLKRDLQDTLASRARRADYLKSQINQLYGPFVFLLEYSHTHIDSARMVDNAAGNLTKIGGDRGISRFLNKEEIEEYIKTLNRYFELASECTGEAVKILRSNWGWLDEDDRTDVLKFAQDTSRHEVEFQEQGKRRLSVDLYSHHILTDAALSAPRILPLDFIRRMSSKLYNKQRELSGLTR
ncbi:hypothetical protein [Myxococcus xanthus]|uniref:hypothetical protein n=1 Tax=Myxococcus xanthus TaxID=34 RepID=UPI001127EBB6|nr:hypothetical protein [Myxococcus xanthus]